MRVPQPLLLGILGMKLPSFPTMGQLVKLSNVTDEQISPRFPSGFLDTKMTSTPKEKVVARKGMQMLTLFWGENWRSGWVDFFCGIHSEWMTRLTYTNLTANEMWLLGGCRLCFPKKLPSLSTLHCQNKLDLGLRYYTTTSCRSPPNHLK